MGGPCPPLRSFSALQSLRSSGDPASTPKGAPERDIFLLVLSVGVGVWRGVLFSLSLKDSLHFWRIKLQHVKIIILTCLVEVADSYSQSTITQMKILTTWKIQIFSITFVTVERLERISPLIYKDISNSKMVIENHFQLAFLHLEKTVVLVSLI